jgi:hypothetical protein
MWVKQDVRLAGMTHHFNEMYGIWMVQPDTWAIAGQSIKASYHLSFKNTTVLVTMAGYMDHFVKESTVIWIHPNNFNRNTWSNLSSLAPKSTKYITIMSNSVTHLIKRRGSLWNIRHQLHFCMADCLRRFCSIQPPWKLQILMGLSAGWGLVT